LGKATGRSGGFFSGVPGILEEILESTGVKQNELHGSLQETAGTSCIRQHLSCVYNLAAGADWHAGTFCPDARPDETPASILYSNIM
jgi:hypothetical protein